MPFNEVRSERTLEVLLIAITVGLTVLLYETAGHKFTVLNLYYLPVVLAGFYLGRYRAGVLALLCVIGASTIIVHDMGNFSTFTSPVATLLAVTIWGSVLGLTSIMVGTLNDERIAKATEAQEAHVGIVGILSKYLQIADPQLKHRAARVSDLGQKVARKMRLSNSEINDIHVASLLVDVENIEITARVIKKAVGELEETEDHQTIHGSELVESLGALMSGAIPLVLNQEEAGEIRSEDIPFGARILQAVRAYDAIVYGPFGDRHASASDAMDELQNDIDVDYHPAVLHALTEVVVAQESRPNRDESAIQENSVLVNA